MSSGQTIVPVPSWRMIDKVRTRFASPIAAVAITVLALTGCTFITPIATQKPYDPSDGVGTDIGDLALRNILLIANDLNEATLVMTVVNSADEDIELNLQYGEAGARVTETVTVPGGQARTRVGDDPGTTIIVSDSTMTLGALFPIYAEYGSVPGEVILVPVLDGTLPEYELYVP
jgi:hypothetical protein